MIELIPDAEYTEWIETGIPRSGRLDTIALRIRQGQTLTIREQALLVYHTKEIESLLQTL